MSKHQANAQSNGWLFEYAAALFLFLHYSNVLSEIGIEKDEDIVIKKIDGHYVAAQAKSSLENERIYNTTHYSEIEASLKTLADVNIDDNLVDEYIAINNFRNPFGNDSPVNFLKDDSQSYSILDFSSEVTNKLKIYCEEENLELDFNKVTYWFIKFQGQDPHAYINSIFKSKIAHIGMLYTPISEAIYDKLLHIFENNSREKRKYLEKDFLLGVIFGCILTQSINIEKIAEYVDIEIDIFDDDLEIKIEKFFNEKSMSLAIYSEITSKYISYCSSNNVFDRKDSLIKYLRILPNEIPLYFKSFFDSSDGDVFKLYKLFVAFVCLKNHLIDKIKEAFNQ